MQQVPIRTRVVLASVGIIGGTVAEQSSKPLSYLQLSGSNVSETKVACIVVVSDELIRFGGPILTNLVGEELRKGLAVQTDTAFIQKISSGITPITSGGATADKIWGDLEAAFECIDDHSDQQDFCFHHTGYCTQHRVQIVIAMPTYPSVPL
jgi:hypothetical protein